MSEGARNLRDTARSMTAEHLIGEPQCEQRREERGYFADKLPPPRVTDLSVLAARALDAKVNGTPGEAFDARSELLGALACAGLSPSLVRLLVDGKIL